MRIRKGLPILWRCDGESQIGTDPQRGLVLSGLYPNEQRLLEVLATNFDRRALGRRIKALAIAPQRLDKIAAALKSAKLVQTESLPGTGPDQTLCARLDDSPQRWISRHRVGIRILGLSRTGVNLALVLAEAGIGTLDLIDTTPVSAVDSYPYLPPHVDKPRENIAREIVSSVIPRVRLASLRQPDLVVIVADMAVDPTNISEVMENELPHCLITVGELGTQVGPLVIPGHSPCFNCIQRHRYDQDPCWPLVYSQLLAQRSTGVETVQAHLGTALGAHMVLDHIDRRKIFGWGESWYVSVLDPIPKVVVWSPHPKCDCITLPDNLAR